MAVKIIGKDADNVTVHGYAIFDRALSPEEIKFVGLLFRPGATQEELNAAAAALPQRDKTVWQKIKTRVSLWAALVRGML